jgi:hypothetical protein
MAPRTCFVLSKTSETTALPPLAVVLPYRPWRGHEPLHVLSARLTPSAPAPPPPSGRLRSGARIWSWPAT